MHTAELVHNIRHLSIAADADPRAALRAIWRLCNAVLRKRPEQDWISTFTGRKFYPLAAKAADVDIIDIAHALSMLCRYNGHTNEFYSVAQHAVLVSYLVPVEHAKWGLLHDSTEAYLPEVTRPVKRHIHGFAESEDRLMEVIAGVFGLEPEMPLAVKQVDTAICKSEKRRLINNPEAHRWAVDEVQCKDIDIDPWSPAEAKRQFLRRFYELFPERQSVIS